MNISDMVGRGLMRIAINATNGFGLGKGTLGGISVAGALALLALGHTQVEYTAKILGMTGAMAVGAVGGGFLAKDGLFALPPATTMNEKSESQGGKRQKSRMDMNIPDAAPATPAVGEAKARPVSRPR